MDCGDIMAELNISISLEEQIGSIESIDEATDFLDEYHELHEAGGEELKDLLFVFAKEGIENEYLRFVFEAHLLGCENCLYTLSRYQLIFKTVDEYGAEPIKAIWAGKLLEEAKTHKEKGNFEEAKKCLKKALELRPWDEEIQEKLSELLEERKPGPSTIPKDDKEIMRQLIGWASSSSARMKDGTSEIPQDLDSLVKRLSILTSESLFLGKIYLYQDVLMGERSFGAERGVDEEQIYMLGERISIDLEPPEDGYLTILLYDDENNLKLLFPEKGTDDICVKGGEKKQFGMVAAEPLCKQYLKAFWTSDQLMIPDQIDFGDESSIRSAIERFLKSISKLGDDDWTVFVQQFDVVEE